MSKLYRELAEIPTPTAAQFLSPDEIRVSFSIRDHIRNVKRQVSKTIVVAPNDVISSPSQDVSGIVASAISPSRARVAVLRETADQGTSGGKKRYVEIWLGDRLELCHDVTDAHGSFYADDHLGSLSFNQSEHTLLYSAEANPPKDEGSGDPYQRFRYAPHFGESLAGKKRPTLYLLKWRNLETSDDAKPENAVSVDAWGEISPSSKVYHGQAIFAGDDHIFTTGYSLTSDGRLLGPKGCYNRPANIWQLTYAPSESALAIPQNGRSCRSPRVFTDSDGRQTVVWLSNPEGGAHASCVSIHAYDVNTGDVKTVLDTVWEPRADGFPGLYPDFCLPRDPFLRLEKRPYIITHSTWGSRSTVLLISTEDGSVKDLTPGDSEHGAYSWAVLAANGEDCVVCTRSTPSVPHEVVFGRVDASRAVSWQVVHKPSLIVEAEKELASLQTSVIPIPGRCPTETIVTKRIPDHPPSTIPPCITMPHGGPHATTTTAFNAANAALALQGYTLSSPNYTGSLGFGETYVRKLLGQCGTLDVQDCIATVNHLIALGISEAGPGKQFVQGGSHGGFLAGHLIGQFPDTFSAAVVRNPVISCGEISTSDIPDWYYAEFGLAFSGTTLMTPAVFSALQAASPITHVDAVRARVLLLVGEADQRVAPTQGVGYYHALKGRGKEVELLCFKGESHPLDGVEASRVGWEAGLEWLQRSE